MTTKIANGTMAAALAALTSLAACASATVQNAPARAPAVRSLPIADMAAPDYLILGNAVGLTDRNFYPLP